MLGAGDWPARVRVARRLLAQAWLPTPAGWLAFRTPSLPLPPLRLPWLRLLDQPHLLVPLPKWLKPREPSG